SRLLDAVRGKRVSRHRRPTAGRRHEKGPAPSGRLDSRGRTLRTHQWCVSRCLTTSEEQRPSPFDGNRTAVHRTRGSVGCQRINALRGISTPSQGALVPHGSLSLPARLCLLAWDPTGAEAAAAAHLVRAGALTELVRRGLLTDEDGIATPADLDSLTGDAVL